MKPLFTFIFTLFSFFSYSQDLFEGLVAYYPFSGSAQDESEYNHDGQVFGAILTEDRFGNPESAYSFNGTDNFIRVEHSEKLNFGVSAPYSVSVWILASQNQEELTVTGNDILSKWFIDGEATQTAGYTLVLRYSNQTADNPFVVRAIRFDGYPGGCNNIQALGQDIQKELWHHIVFSFDNNGFFKLYFDGELKEETQNILTCTPQNNSPLLIGKRGAAPHPLHFTGKIDDLRIYERALTEEEVTLLYEEMPSSIEKKQLTDFTIHPNPAEQNLSLILPSDDKVKNIRIIDLQGRTVLTEKYRLEQNINIKRLVPSLYFLLLEGENGQLIGREKFIKTGVIQS